MADRTQLKVVDRNDIADDDPFAELTRIMGFYPRQAARPQAPAVERAAPAENVAHDADFDIDLEKELMGEFDFADEEAAPQFEDQARAYQDTAASDELIASRDQDFVFDDAADHSHFATTHASEPVADIAFDEDFDRAVASSFELPPEAPAEMAVSHEGLSIDQEMAASLDHGFHSDPGMRHEPDMAAFDADFDNAVQMSLDDETAFDGRELAQGHEATAMQPAEHAAAAYQQTDDFDSQFDEAMADVEMDSFRQTAPEPQVPAYQAQASETVAHVPHFAPEPIADPEPVAEQAFDDDFELSFRDALTEEPEAPSVEPVAAFEPSFAEPLAAAAIPAIAPVEPVKPAVAAAGERSLEDELNALLGAMTARPVPAAPAPVAREPVAMPQPVVRPASPAVQHAPAVDDLNWNIDEGEAVRHSVDGDLDTLLASELDGHDFANAGEHVEHGIDFDDEAFDAAVAKGMQADPVEAAEPSRSWSRVTPVAVSGQVSLAAQPGPAPLAPQMAMPTYRQEPVEDYSAYARAVAAAAVPLAEPVRHHEARHHEEMPDVETVDVPERVVALADDLDIPELSFEEDQPSAQAYDDLDAEFASLLTEMNATEIAAANVPGRGYEDDSYNTGFKSGYDRQELRAEAAAAPAAASYAASTSQFDEDDLPGSRSVSQADKFAVDELDYDPELDEAMTVPGLAERQAAKPRGRGFMVAAIVGAVVIAGGLGALAFSFGGKGGRDAPVIVKADNSPIKIKPENPGGTVVPNQDNKVYDAVIKGGGAKPAEPVQEKLVTNNEVPVDVASKEPPPSRVVDLSPDETDAAPGTDAAGTTNPTAGSAEVAEAKGDQQAAPAPKSEDRIAQVLQDADKGGNNDVVAVAPRKVKTMMVKPDGSLVPREDPAPKIAAAEPTDPAPQHVAPTGQSDAQQTGTVVPPADQGNDDQAAAVKPAKAAKAEGKAQSSNTPAKVPVAPPRPSDQPVDIVGEVKPDQVASIDPAAGGGGSWSMQIASQPTVESAQSTYQDLQRRYGSVLAGRSASIVKAEIAGKGTFYRVRVPAQSRNDAINLCTSYKAAGGTCFVSR